MRRLRGEAGLTLIELLVAQVMSLAVFGAALTLLVVYLHGQQASTQRNDAQDRARLTMDLIAHQLRNISSPITSPKLIERATPYDLVFQTVGVPSGSNVGGAERVRYCIPNDTATGDPTKEVLITQTQTWSTASAPAIPWSTTSCPDTTSTNSIVIPSVTNRYQGRSDRPAFTYNNGSTPSDLSQITTVQMDMFVNPTPSTAAAETELRSAVYLRNQLRAPSASFTYTDAGGGIVVLNGATSWDPDGQDLSYSWACTSSSCPSSSILAGSTTGLVTWSPGDGTYTIQLTVTDTTGLSATSTQQVSVT